ncbi:VOC family protein [Cytophagaceae bacterium YF14B1]|uniref:VOC family protein n=1 Tax=Xanthocytophaga flava TaxID=3048013 RepID=A0AAE3R0J3_9BACT|nr:VOC family protein [Xanthocytophaga flavus]MDJ1485888.1 VOC family protein [Xanthocytophaga flavus]
MEVKSLSPNLMVKNVQATVDFYQKTLGFQVLTTVPHAKVENELQWALLQSGPVTLMFQEEENLKEEYPELVSQKPGGGLTLYMAVRDLSAWYEKVKGTAHIIQEPHQTFYGATEFAIQDPNGYILTLSEHSND